MAEAIVENIQHIQSTEQVSAAQVIQAAEIPPTTYRRWEKNLAVGQPAVHEPGPKPTGPLDMEALMDEISTLAHGRERTHGTGALYEEHRDAISRRDLQELVAETRDAINAAKDQATRHLEWCLPGSVWATDTTEIKIGDAKYYVQTIRDLASRYTITPYLNHVPTDEEVAHMLEEAFKRYGAPLFLKRDNGKNENGTAVAAVLAAWHVIPLNSPVAYPQYNGSVERAQDEIQKQLAAAVIPTPCAPEHIAAHIARAAHELNHNPRAVIGGECACIRFHNGKKRATVTLKQREEVKRKITEIAVGILKKTGGQAKAEIQKAWRKAVEKWLLETGQVTEKTEDVLPSLAA